MEDSKRYQTTINNHIKNTKACSKITQNQSVYFSVLKAILIYCVVFAHLCEYFLDNTALFVLVGFIYTFHMPLFAFATGVFGKFSLSRFFGAFLLYFVFSTLRLVLNIVVSTTPVQVDFLYILNKFIDPQWTLWYLLAYAVWLLTYLFIKNVKVWQILLAFIIPLFLGFVPWINTYFSASRIFYFLPFFLAGRYVMQNKDKFFDLLFKAQNVKGKLIAGLSLIFVLVFFIFSKDIVGVGWLYGRSGYNDAESFLFAEAGILFRFTGYLLSIVACVSILFLLPYRKEGEFKTRFMRELEKLVVIVGKSTLSVYLIHSFLVSVYDYLMHDFMVNYPIVMIASLVIVPLAITALLSIKWIAKPIGLLANPIKLKKTKNTDEKAG